MTDNDRILVEVPARGEFARTVRLAAAEVAARCGLSIDDVEDVRLAVDEAFMFATSRAAGDQVRFVFQPAQGQLIIEVGPLLAAVEPGDEAETGERYARFILEHICDEYDSVERDGATYFRLVKRAG